MHETVKENSAERVPEYYKRRRRRGDELGQVLLRLGFISPEQLREALRQQGEMGGHLGAILRRMGACDSQAVATALIEQVRLAREKGHVRNLANRAREDPSLLGLSVQCRPRSTIALIILSDVVALGIAVGLAWLAASHDAPARLQRYGIGAIVPLSVVAFTAVQLYAVTPPGPPEELRRLTLSLTIVSGGLWLAAFMARSGGFEGVSHAAWVIAWLLAVLLAPIGRGLVRQRFASRPWWGKPVVVFGAGKVGRAVVRTLLSRPQLGLKPVAVLDDDATKHGTLRATWGDHDIQVEQVPESVAAAFHMDAETPSTRAAAWENFSEVESVPVLGGLELAPVLAQRLGTRSAVIAMPEIDSATLLSIIERYAENYTSVLAIPDLFKLVHFGGSTRELGGLLGIEVRRQLLLTGPRMAKRALDLAITSVGSLFLLPILVTLGLLVKLDSAGTVFYRQKRLGQDGVRFSALKFRTMFGDGEQRLAELLAKDEKLREQYDLYHKLTDDPRVTRVGRFLRKYSLDELPQIWNVFVGDMSLVGPRPYIEREIPEMDQNEAIILRVKPGITGMWQVMGRNASTFDERVQMDVEYVRSWSPWLDLYILARTVPVVLGGTGS